MDSLRLLLVLALSLGLSSCIEPVDSGDPDAGDREPIPTDPLKGTERVSGKLTLGPLFGVTQARTHHEPDRILPREEPKVTAAQHTQAMRPRIVPMRELTADDVAREELRVPSPLWRSNILPGEVLLRRDPEQVRAGPMRAIGGGRFEVRALPRPFHTVEHLRFRHADGSMLSEDETLELIASLEREPGVLSASPNRWIPPTSQPNDPSYARLWHYRAIQLPVAWSLQPSAGDTSVAVVDTGVLFNHPDLANTFLPGADLISNPEISLDGDGRDMDPTDPGGDGTDGRSTWHGTHVGGTVSAIRDNGVGIAGVARTWHTPIRVLGKGGGTTADIIAGVAWAGRVHNGGLPQIQYVPHVINLSLGGEGPPVPAMQDVLDVLHANRVLVVVAAGNAAIEASGFWPCNQQRVICVGSVGQSLKLASYSNHGSGLTLVAPGGELAEDLDSDGYPDGVLSTVNDGRYQYYEGTSMAAPHVSGVLAMMQAARQDAGLPLLTFEQARQILTSTATPVTCPKGCGAGLLNAAAAVWAAKGNTGPVPGPAKLEVPASAIRLADEATVQLQLSNTGGFPLRVTASFQSPDGIQVEFPGGTTLDIPPSSSRTLAIRARRGAHGNGSYSGVLRLTPDTGSAVNLPADIWFGPPPGADRPAMVIFYARDAQGEWEPAYRKVVHHEDDHRFEMRVAPGTYLVMASVDEDGNDWFFEEGERMGAWPLREQPMELTVVEGVPLSGINFTLSSAPAR